MIAQGFPDDLELEMLPDGIHCVLLKDFRYVDHNRVVHTARQGLCSDGISYPWPFSGNRWSGKRRYAAVVHDQLCADLRELPRDKRWVARQGADDLICEMCRFLGDTEHEAGRVYAGVRIGWYYEWYIKTT